METVNIEAGRGLCRKIMTLCLTLGHADGNILQAVEIWPWSSGGTSAAEFVYRAVCRFH